MFKNRSKAINKGKRLPLLGLALKDREWKVDEGAVHYTDIKNKVAYFNQRFKDPKIETALSVIEAKYCDTRVLKDVKHLENKYIPLAMRMSAYWYYQKKLRADGHMASKYRSLVYTLTSDMTGLCESNQSFMVNEILRRGSAYDIAVMLIQNPHTCLDTYYFARRDLGRAVAKELARINPMSDERNPMFQADIKFITERLADIIAVVSSAWYQIHGTRADAKVVTNKKLKQVAQYLYDELENHKFDFTLPSEKYEQLNQDSWIDDKGVLAESTEHINRSIANTIKDSYERDDAISKWGNMEIKNYPFLEQLPIKIRGRSKKYSDRGVSPRAMHRHTTDRKVFTAPAKRKGGTVLIDVSGSMSLSNYEIEELVRLLPASTIAMYSGSASGKPNDIHGALHILAQDGKWVKDIPEHDGENIIDGPAIDWLGKMPFPRLLVSDMQVSGIGWNKATDEYGHAIFDAEFTLEAINKVANYKIIPIANVQTAIEWVEA
tara:strand:+ start:2333 stop:3808 length:1476 start_codon:yes stop_codon:yes gene_type:complete